MIKILLSLCLFLFPVLPFALTRTTGLPKGFVWSYYPDEKSTQPRGGMAWRAGIILGDSIFLLSTETLVCLDMQGQRKWIYRLPAEGMNNEAKLMPLSKDILVVATTDTLLKVDIQTGKMLTAYSHDTKRRAAFQPTLLLPRYSFIYEENIYAFIWPSLLKFYTETLSRTEAKHFSSSPKTLPLIYKGRLAIALDNGFLELYDLKTGEKQSLISGSPLANFSIRQPLIHKDLLFVPASDELLAYQNTDIFARNKTLTNAILSEIDGRLWMRGHNTGIISEIDETLSVLKEARYSSPTRAGFIDAPLAGTSNRLLHLEALNGSFTVLDSSDGAPKVLQQIVSEDFNENPPLQILGAAGPLILIGGFDGAFLINLDNF